MLQMRAEKRAQNARNAAMDANIARNRNLEQEAALAIGKSRDEFDRTDSFDPVESAATELASQYNANTKPMPVNVVSLVRRVWQIPRQRSLQLTLTTHSRTKLWQTLILLASTQRDNQPSAFTVCGYSVDGQLYEGEFVSYNPSCKVTIALANGALLTGAGRTERAGYLARQAQR